MIEQMNDFIKWKLIIKRIIFYLNESNENNCSRKNKYFDLWYDNTFNKDKEPVTEEDIKQQSILLEKWTTEQNNIDEYRKQCVTKAFELISKYFFNLWD